MATAAELTRQHQDALKKWGSLRGQTNDKKVLADAKSKADEIGRQATAADTEERRKKGGPGSSLAARLLGRGS